MLLQGDELSVQLFIGAAALTALSVAMTQAGWTHRWFVRGMFALATLLTAASVGWPYFQSRIPLISDALQVAASSRAGWLLVGIVPAFVGGMLLSDSLRRRRETSKAPNKWFCVFLSMQILARRDLIDRYKFVSKQVGDTARECIALEERLSKLVTAGLMLSEIERSEMSQEYAMLSAEKDRIGKKNVEWIETQENCQEALRMNIHSQLMDGELVAKGFLAPHTPGTQERIIPKEEWRFLSLDDNGDQALGPNFEYIALLIGRPGH